MEGKKEQKKIRSCYFHFVNGKSISFQGEQVNELHAALVVGPELGLSKPDEQISFTYKGCDYTINLRNVTFIEWYYEGRSVEEKMQIFV
jgi:hypothetical protein